MKKLIKKIIALMAAFQLFMNIPVIGLLNVSAADAFAYQDALIPIETFATAIAIGSGIVASSSQAALDGASEMLRKAIASMKAKACLDSETEFRVIDGGKPRKPQKGDDKNHKKWFTVAAGSVATGSLIAGLKASREMMSEIYDNEGYTPMQYNQGIIDLSDVYKIASWQYTYNQMASDAKALAKQMDNIKSYMEQKGYNVNNYFYTVISEEVTKYSEKLPLVEIYAYKRGVGNYSVLNYNPSNFKINYATTSTNYNYYSTSNIRLGTFYNDIDLVQSIDYLQIRSNSYNPTTSNPDLSIKKNSTSVFKYPNFGGFPIYGFYPFIAVRYGFTNKVYNPKQTQDVNFPDWLQQSVETLNGNLAGLNLAINNLQLPQTWNDTQTNIQTGTAPANVINQYINNWSNPEQAPDPNPEPDPGPNPDPVPEPEPEPGQQPASESAVEEAGQGLFDWAMGKIKLPDGFFDKLPFSIPYDIYLLLKSLFPSKSGGRMVYSVRAHSGSIGDTDPSGLIISSNFDASGISTRTYASSGGSCGTSNKWVDNAPVINLDIHWKYHDVQGNVKSIDIVKTVDLSSIGYFAMIIYISVYVFWFFNLLHWLMGSFKG